MPALPFPLSSTPGQYPGEGQGRLVNVYATKAGDEVTWRRVPGLTLFSAGATEIEPRGFIAVGTQLFGAFRDKVLLIDAAGAVTAITNALGGVAPVTWARNNRTPTPDLVGVSENGAFVVASGAVGSYPDADLPAVNSCAFFDGYFLFTTAGGRLYASDLNSTAINALSFTTCEGAPDGLLRVVASNGIAYAMGEATIEAYQNAATSPFPLARVGVMSVGLRGPWAVAGFGEGWDGPIIFVAADATVRALSGLDTKIVSTVPVERAIAKAASGDLRASVYVHDGNPVWVLSAPGFTWEYNTRTGQWNERASLGALTWRSRQSAFAFGKWIVGDTLVGNLYAIDPTRDDEWGIALEASIESGPVKSFPARSAVNSALLDIVVGRGLPTGIAPTQTNPKVQISYSHDGAGSWSIPMLRPIGPMGLYDKTPRVNRLGMTTAQGIRIKATVSDAVPFVFKGGFVDGSPRSAP
jgi:hypothetical protein